MSGSRSWYLGLTAFFLLCAWSCLSCTSSRSAVLSDDRTAVQNRVKELEAQLASCSGQVSNVQTENDLLRQALAQISVRQPLKPPKGSVPFDFNGMRFYVMPAVSDQHPVPSKP
jgi:hypothetical protein